MRCSVLSVTAIFLTLPPSGRVEGVPPPELQPLVFLVGEWEASQEQPDHGSGRTLFSWSLQDRVILRTNYADYPASGDEPASRHDDLMVIYVAAAGALRADYYDSEGHVIRYSVASPAAGEAVFVSERIDGESHYRLSYKLEQGDLLKGEFAIAPPDQPDSFRPYLTWQSRRLLRK